jgi:hypothetical protein
MAKNQINSTLETNEEKPKTSLLRNAEKDAVALTVEPALKFKIAKSLLCLEILNPRSQMSSIDLV